MANEIIYVCNSTNNKNVREGELEILRKFEDRLYFEFGENEMNIKKRFYNDLETLNKDFDALIKLKNSEQISQQIVEDETLSKETEEVQEAILKDLIKEKEEPKKIEKKSKRKNSLF